MERKVGASQLDRILNSMEGRMAYLEENCRKCHKHCARYVVLMVRGKFDILYFSI